MCTLLLEVRKHKLDPSRVAAMNRKTSILSVSLCPALAGTLSWAFYDAILDVDKLETISTASLSAGSEMHNRYSLRECLGNC